MSPPGERVKTPCEWCGGGYGVQALEARDRHTGRRVILRLCAGCRTERSRTWRLRYAEEGPARV
jgi:hypothetical protein